MSALRTSLKIIVFCFIFNAVSCIEPFEITTEDFDNTLVIEANLTDEIRFQEILLSRTFSSNGEIVFEGGATINITDSDGNLYNFEEKQEGEYVSVIAFGAVGTRRYKLNITTSDGRSYSSAEVELPSKAILENVEAVRVTDLEGVDGVSILVSTVGKEGEDSFFRYTYEETYKIISFYNAVKKYIIISENPRQLELVDLDSEVRTCYNTRLSSNIFLNQTAGLSENRIDNFELRFIDRLSRIVAERYSILVNQYSQSREAYQFYKNLKEFSSSESLFTQTQPGFIAGNIVSNNNPDERVLGIFEITAVSSKRIFFDFSDIFGSSTRFFPDCPGPISLTERDLFNVIKNNTFQFAQFSETGTALVAPIDCVDCTRMQGSNVVPDFWEE